MRGRENKLLHLLEERAIRLVVYGPPSLVLNDIALCIELRLRDRGQELAHPIGFQP